EHRENSPNRSRWCPRAEPSFERRSCLGFDGEGQLVFDQRREGKPGTGRALPFDVPAFSVSDNLHLAAFAPPPVHFAGESGPEAAITAQSCEVGEQLFVCCSRAP